MKANTRVNMNEIVYAMEQVINKGQYLNFAAYNE